MNHQYFPKPEGLEHSIAMGANPWSKKRNTPGTPEGVQHGRATRSHGHIKCGEHLSKWGTKVNKVHETMVTNPVYPGSELQIPNSTARRQRSNLNRNQIIIPSYYHTIIKSLRTACGKNFGKNPDVGIKVFFLKNLPGGEKAYFHAFG